MRYLRTTLNSLMILLVITMLPVFATGAFDKANSNTQPRLLCALTFFRGHVVGKGPFTNGPKVSADKGKTWKNLAWPEEKGFAIDVSPDGRRVYSAQGNGVMVSSDGGQNWRLTGGWRMTEVKDVRMDRRDPHRAWAAGSYGLFYTDNGGDTWMKPGEPQPFGYLSCICPDRRSRDRIFIGSEKGIFITDDNGERYRKVGPEAIIRTLWQDLRDGDVVWAGTDGDGLWVSRDNCFTWNIVQGVDDMVDCVTQHPVYRDRIYVGNDLGMALSWDSGKTWTKGAGEFGPESSVYALAFDPDDDLHIFAGCRDGFFESYDGGYNWKFGSERGGVISDLYYGDLYVGPPEPLSEEPGKLVINRTQPKKGYYTFPDPWFNKRASLAMEWLATQPYGEKPNLLRSVAIIKEGKADDAFYEKLRATLQAPTHSMFWFLESIGLYLYCRDELPPDIRDLLRQVIITTPIVRGDTENHWVMYHTAKLLAAQTFPKASANEWFTGRTSQENYDDAAEWVANWSTLTATRGQGEFDSPVYNLAFLIPMVILNEFAVDPDMKRRAEMMVDLLLADFADDALEGRYCGGHSRIYDTQVRWGDGSRDRNYFYYYFGDIPAPAQFEDWDTAIIYGSYRCPQAIVDIAHRRSVPFVTTEVKRVRYLMRYSDSPDSPAYEYGGMMSPPVYRYNYMTPDYCMGSLQGGILQPIQQHTWDVTWKGSAYNTVCFTLHPYWSGYELAMFFPEDPHLLTAAVQATKGDYTDPDKWTSSSPYERIYQLEDALIAVYNVPEGTDTDHVDLFLPKCLHHEIQKGWIFGQDGDFYIGIRPLVPGEWREHADNWRYRVHAGQVAFIVETGRKADDGDYESFINAIFRVPMPTLKSTDTGPVVECTTRHGRNMIYRWDGDMRLMDDPVTPFPTDKLYAGPLMDSDVGSGIITIKGDKVDLILDFNKLTIEEMPN